jgi:hypothetical protein
METILAGVPFGRHAIDAMIYAINSSVTARFIDLLSLYSGN